MEVTSTAALAGLVASSSSAASTSELSSSAPPPQLAQTFEDAESSSRHSGGHYTVKPAPQMPNLAESSSKGGGGTRFHEECHETDNQPRSLRSSRQYKGKGKEAVPVDKKKPLRLLDLPVDILKDIVKEVTHTNDLTSLALCHSALHRLTIPHIYSRFDIVWPDSSTHAEPRSGVDALTYGLATLVMAEEIFGEAPNQQLHQRQSNNRFSKSGNGRATEMAVRRRRGNHYAQFTKKFSLGNGPTDWVQEYLISKEGGKMLGTLVALAVARMRSLETFIWDMPTGILRDVWLALSSLGDRDDGQACRLEKLWVRWHDNSANNDHLQGHPHGIAQLPTIPGQPSLPQISTAHLDRVEHPSFSVLPSLKSLSVLDIDELAYLDEMAVLIGKSLDKLRELRVGIARHAINKDWVTVWEGDVVHQVDRDYPTAGSVTIGEKRLGGVLGTLTGFVCDMRKPRVVLPDRTKLRRRSSPVAVASAVAHTISPPEEPLSNEPSHAEEATVISPGSALSFTSPTEPSSLFGFSLPETPIVREEAVAPETTPEADVSTQEASNPPEPTPFSPPAETFPLEIPPDDPEPRLSHKLKLESLELERVPLSIPVLQKGIDWPTLTSLTLLDCPNHEHLWKTLRRTFAPRPKSPVYPHARRSSSNTQSPRKSTTKHHPEADLEYSLHLKKIHTNTVSPSLITFLKETLAPNTLQVLFLQDSAPAFHSPSVSISSIHRGPLRRHRSSLQKLLIDSSEKSPDGSSVPVGSSSRFRRWMLNRETLSWMMSGKMVALRELGVAMDYRDWHFFLQNLPQGMKGLRSLYLLFLEGWGNGGAGGDWARELALQVVDIVALRGDVEVCYLGVGGKCFEILERGRGEVEHESTLGVLPPGDGEEDEDEDEDEEDIDEEDEGGEEDEDENSTESDDDDDDDDDDDNVSLMSEEEGRGGNGGQRLRLREILFYDDKVAIFKARHGRL